MLRPFAITLVIVGLMMMAGPEYFLTGVGLMLLGMYLSGTGSTGRASEVICAVVALAGGLGVLAVFVQFAWQRLTALP